MPGSKKKVHRVEDYMQRSHLDASSCEMLRKACDANGSVHNSVSECIDSKSSSSPRGYCPNGPYGVLRLFHLDAQ